MDDRRRDMAYIALWELAEATERLRAALDHGDDEAVGELTQAVTNAATVLQGAAHAPFSTVGISVN